MLNIEILKGTRLNAIGRAAAMCWISLGNLIEIESRSGLRTVGQYALDVDCPWRIRCNSKILLASTDMFEPASTHQHDETFEWDIQGNNLFDERVAMLCNNVPRFGFRLRRFVIRFPRKTLPPVGRSAS